jgi:hypothetical protein
MLQPGSGILDRRGQKIVAQLLADDLGMKEWFGFDGHGVAATLAAYLGDGK